MKENENIWVSFRDHLIYLWLTMKYSLICHGWNILSEVFKRAEIDVDPGSTEAITHTLARSTTSAIFQISSTSFYIRVVTLSIRHTI